MLTTVPHPRHQIAWKRQQQCGGSEMGSISFTWGPTSFPAAPAGLPGCPTRKRMPSAGQKSQIGASLIPAMAPKAKKGGDADVLAVDEEARRLQEAAFEHGVSTINDWLAIPDSPLYCAAQTHFSPQHLGYALQLLSKTRRVAATSLVPTKRESPCHPAALGAARCPPATLLRRTGCGLLASGPLVAVVPSTH